MLYTILQHTMLQWRSPDYIRAASARRAPRSSNDNDMSCDITYAQDTRTPLRKGARVPSGTSKLKIIQHLLHNQSLITNHWRLGHRCLFSCFTSASVETRTDTKMIRNILLTVVLAYLPTTWRRSEARFNHSLSHS